MTNEEARKNLEKLLLLYDDGMVDFSVIRESVKVAIQALEHHENAITCEGCRYDNMEDNPCYDCMRMAQDFYEPENSPAQMSGTSDLISRQLAIHTITSYDGVVDKSVAKRLLIQLPPTQPERLTDDDFETIRIHLSAYKERLCNQHRWEEAEEYQRIIDRFMRFASEQPEIIHCKDCKHYIPYDWMFDGLTRSSNRDDYAPDEIGCAVNDHNYRPEDYCSNAERRTDG